VRTLPRGRHFAVTWSIPDDFGGMTRALLLRSQAFARLGGATVDILTFDARPDYPAVEQRLRAEGTLIDGVALLNLYDWLRAHPLPGGSLRLGLHPFTPLDREGVELTQTRFAGDGTVVQVDHYRRDGTLLLSDRRDTRQRGVPGGRSVVLCDEHGMPVRSWGRIHHLYRAWLDRLTGRTASFMIVDSKTIARFMVGYRRPHVTTLHVVHASHRSAGGGLRPTRRETLENATGFDSVVLLSERQRRDLRAVLGPEPRLSVIPNFAPVPGKPGLERDATRGVVLASLTSRKRVDHAVSAALAVLGDQQLTLDVYGDGDQRARLEGLADHGHGAVRLHGHRADARAELERASFLLATGRSEGMPLVLVEAMAAGCIPIAYDVAYGPSDLIDGVNGILVPSGDIDGLADAMRTLLNETPVQLARRRRRARRTAQRYTDAVITAQWARELRAAARHHAEALAAPAARAS
jgi:poly(glycerol-phosphate) alpha-glucosyltransferase